ncbi:MAG: dihydroorotase [Pseudohongiellaceae bacterium]
MTQQITLTTPDDWHLHLRDGEAMADVVSHSAAVFDRAIIMPNLKPPVVSTAQAAAYRQRILDAVPGDSTFEPLMTLYLTDRTTPSDIYEAAASGFVKAVKLYPAGATTNSDSGVTSMEAIRPALLALAETAMPLLVHGEVTRPEIDIFDREAVFIEEVLKPLRQQYPSLKIVLEHITTQEAVEFVTAAGPGIAATITAHHLLHDRNDMLVGGIRPHLYCLPILKRNRHRQALLEAATGGDPKFFLGTDSAPHARGDKESDCGCAGCYTAHAALPLYAQVFEQAGALERLEAFASHHGPDFYGLPRNRGRITLQRTAWTVPDHYPFGNSRIVPLQAGQQLDWQVANPQPQAHKDKH